MRSPLMPISSTACGKYQRIQNFKQFQQRASAIGGRAVGDLAHHDVVIEAVPLRQANRQQFQQACRTSRRLSRPDRGGSLPRLAGAQHFAHLARTGGSQLLDQFDHAIALVAPHAAEESVGQMFHAPPDWCAATLPADRRDTGSSRNASSMNSGSRFSTPIRGRKIAGQYRPLLARSCSMAAHTSFTAP